MDPSLAHALEPFLGVLALGAIPASLVFIIKHFKLRTRELELEAELHGRDSQARIMALETRISAIEAAIGSLAQSAPRRELMSPPDAPEALPPPVAKIR